MTLALDFPPTAESPLSRLDPRWKLAAFALAGVSVAALRTPAAAGAACAAAAALAVLGRLPWRWAARRLGALAVFLLPFAVLLPLLVPDGLRTALLISAKALALATLTLVLLATAPLDATLKAAHSLRVPGLLVQLTLLALRYAFVVADELARLRVALRVRGYRHRANRHGYRTVGRVAGTLLVRSHERAERVAHAMRCRGFDGRFRSLTAFRTTAADVTGFVLITSAAAGLLLWSLTPAP